MEIENENVFDKWARINFEFSNEVLVNGSPDSETAVYVTKEDLIRRLHYGWTLKDIVEFALEENKQ